MSSTPSHGRPTGQQDLTLEVELDLPLDPEDIASFHRYVAAGLSSREAARQVAQDLLGSMGAVVQGAEAVPS